MCFSYENPKIIYEHVCIIYLSYDNCDVIVHVNVCQSEEFVVRPIVSSYIFWMLLCFLHSVCYA